MNETTSEWIAYVDRIRKTNANLARGEWHGYTSASGGTAPMRGRYYLVRWNDPTVAVSDDDWVRVIGLAWTIEEALKTADEPVPA